jgi:hypothetical protein
VHEHRELVRILGPAAKPGGGAVPQIDRTQLGYHQRHGEKKKDHHGDGEKQDPRQAQIILLVRNIADSDGQHASQRSDERERERAVPDTLGVLLVQDDRNDAAGCEKNGCD